MTLSNVDQFNDKVWVSFFSWITLPSEAMIITIMVLKSERSFAFALLFLAFFAHTYLQYSMHIHTYNIQCDR